MTLTRTPPDDVLAAPPDETRARRERSIGPAGLLLAASAVALAILSLLGLIVVVAFNTNGIRGTATWTNFHDLFQSSFAVQSIGNTLIYMAVATVTSVLIGVPAAWIIERTDLPGKSMVHAFFVVGMLIPGFFVAMGWLIMFHPHVGLVNELFASVFHTKSGPFNVVTIPGMGFVQGLSLAPVVFAMTSATFKTMDQSLEEAARTAGGTFLQQMRRVTLPLSWPSILAATLYVAIIAFGAFDIPAIIGLSARKFTFSTFLFYNVNPQAGFPRYGLVAAFSTFMIVIGGFLSWSYSRVLRRANQYRVITGKNYKPSVVALGRWTWGAWAFLGSYILIATVMPLLGVLWSALSPQQQPLSVSALSSINLDNLTQLPWPLVRSALLHTVIIMLAVPTLTLIWSTVFSWITVRSKYRFRAVFDYVAFVPHAVPSLILGMGAFLFSLFVLPKSWGLYGSLLLLVVLMSLVAVSFGSRMTNSALMQIHPELEEAAAVSGASLLTTFRRVLAPLLRPTFQNAWLWLAVLSFRDLTVPLIMFSRDNMTLSVTVWNLWSGGNPGQAAMITVLMLIVVSPLALLYLRLSRGNPSPQVGAQVGKEG
ncbi:ABC transporter permease [Catenulispora pinisilvae]|uniref:ABC transporter permease n=1 Tax=Catenulispora pinisilvae TaxID=2705253 RepID=UPI0018915223|nr:iron ABC transporter permease [Catenulispora pinisilvae]